MNIILVFFLTTISLLSIGCAAPMTELVAKHQDGTVDQQLFKEGDELWVSYRDKDGILKKTRGTVVYKDSDSVRLDPWYAWRRTPVDIEYRQINTLSRPVKEGWVMGISLGTFTVERLFSENFPPAEFRSVGFSPRYALYSNHALEANLLVGRSTRVDGWVGVTLNHHAYLIIPRTYWLWGVGLTSPLSKFDSGHLKALYRLGFGLTNPLFSRINIRLEVETGSSNDGLLYGFRVCFERKHR